MMLKYSMFPISWKMNVMSLLQFCVIKYWLATVGKGVESLLRLFGQIGNTFGPKMPCFIRHGQKFSAPFRMTISHLLK